MNKLFIVITLVISTLWGYEHLRKPLIEQRIADHSSEIQTMDNSIDTYEEMEKMVRYE